MVLTIISHTPHYSKNGFILGWGPTVKEINQLTGLFSTVYHIAPLHSERCPRSAEKYASNKIKYVPIIPTGGLGLLNKLNVIYSVPFNFRTIHKICIKSDWVQFRGPTNLGLYVLPYLSIFSNQRRWIKYGGSWNQKDIPFTYSLQRLWLQNNIQNSKVIISGRWPNQKGHLLTFENPCFSREEIRIARNHFFKKKYFSKLNICFVGHMDNNKGAGILIESLNNMDLLSFNNIYFVGDGPKKHIYEKKSNKNKNNNIYFTGQLSRESLNKIYAECHIIILPSLSEGFPKVIAEAASYGCVPIVTNIGSIGQYINKENGILLQNSNTSELISSINKLEKDRILLKKLALNVMKISDKFSYEKYVSKLYKILR